MSADGPIISEAELLVWILGAIAFLVLCCPGCETEGLSGAAKAEQALPKLIWPSRIVIRPSDIAYPRTPEVSH